MHLGAAPPYLWLLRRNFCAAGGVLLWLQRCDFWTLESLFSLTTAAQNIHVFLRKSPLLKEHFFELLKTAISSTACGTSTLKSPLLLGSDAPHVHPRLRKHSPRCTLDCGFKTPESPALRGFVAGLRTLATAALYLVLLSNGFHRPKIRLKKFGFSLTTTSANIAKKLPPQRCSKPFFNFSHKRPTFAFTGESGYILGSLRKIAHNGLHGETRAFRMGWYHYPRSVPHGSETLRGRGLKRQTLPLLGLGRGCSRRTQRACGTAMRLCASLSRRRRGPAGLRDLFTFVEVAACTPCAQGLSACARRGVVSPLLVCSACCWNAGRPLVKAAILPFSEVG